ncbi:MAG: Sensor protein BasS [Paracidovorax wautersii]|uniref:histidine kinase n=1 Tax=Paracidovorax wautersii TaxID=1177982 RepID=A0A7V8FNP7_9BURK|nr:MAG: Sensor protein BasS [Paracidovorax wautersii]
MTRPTAPITDKPPARLADRLARTLLLALASVWLLCIAGVAWFIYAQVNANFDRELVESAHRLIDVAVSQYDDAVTDHQYPVHGPMTATDPLINTEPLVYQLIDGQGHVLLRSAAAPVQPFGIPIVDGFYDHGAWRIYVAEHPYRELYLQLADPQEERTDVLVGTLFALVAAMVLVLLGLTLLMRGIARRELAVLQHLQTQIGQRGDDDLRPIDVSGMPQEPRAVGEGVNRLLERLKGALDVERALAANAAHELRTPLAVAMLRLQAALDGNLAREDVQAALSGLKTLAHRTEKLLQLSRAKSAAALGQEPVDLSTLAATVAGEFWSSADAQRRLDLLLPDNHGGGGQVCALGDADTLAIALRNLVENALRYSAGAAVQIEVMAPATLVVRDFGPGVDAAQMQTLERRHVRHTQDRMGYGLGMSITTSIVARQQGTLRLASPPQGHPRGFEARIELPPV